MDETLGNKLREIREAKQLSLDQISKELHIRVRYLEAIEKNSLESIPTKVQARGFVRSYSSYLGIPLQDLPDGPWQDNIQTPTLDKIKQLNIERTTALNPASSTLLFKEIGETLKSRREVLGLGREDIDSHTHIPTHYVDYMESGEFDLFPSPAQARGMLTNYLSFLDIPQDEIMLKYAEALQQELSARQVARDAGQSDSNPSRNRLNLSFPRMPQWVRTFLSPDLVLVSSLGVLVILITIWGIGRVTRTQSELSPPPTAPSLVEALLPTSTQLASPTSTILVTSNSDLVNIDENQPETTLIPTVQVAESSSIQVFIIVRQRAYLKVIVDGSTAFDGRVLPNDNLTFAGLDSVEVISGNAAALQVIYNDQDMGILGIFGEVVKIIYTREGVIRPTPLPTPTSQEQDTLTPTPTNTPEEGPDLPPSQNTPIP